MQDRDNGRGHKAKGRVTGNDKVSVRKCLAEKQK